MGLRAWSVASAPDRLRSKPLQPPPDGEGAVAPYLVQDRIPWTRWTPSGVGAVFLQLSRRFPNPWSRGSATRGALHGEGRASARPLWNTGKKQTLLWLFFMGVGIGENKGKHQYFPCFQKMPAGGGLQLGEETGTCCGRGSGVGGKAAVRSRDDGEGAIATQGGGVGRGGAFQPFPERMVARKRDRGGLHGEGHASACPQWKQLARQRGPELLPRHPSPKSGWTSQRGTGKMANRHPVRFSRAGKQRERTGTKTK